MFPFGPCITCVTSAILLLGRGKRSTQIDIEQEVAEEVRGYDDDVCVGDKSFTDRYHSQKALIIDLKATAQLPCHHWLARQ